MLEPFGHRVARLRNAHGWTQQDLADRIAISRVAVSHLEMGISTPSERTVALLAGLFKHEPAELVEGTTYPDAKSERLPLVAARYTEVELQIQLMRRDLEWLDKLGDAASELGEAIRVDWRQRLARLEGAIIDPHEIKLLRAARTELERRTSGE